MRLVQILVGLGLLVAAAGDAEAKPKAKPKKPPVKVASTRVAPKPSKSGCRDQHAARWLGSNPITPFLIVGKKGLVEAGQPCCESWAEAGKQWHTIGAWGEIVGSARVTGSDYYDVTRCEEIHMKVTKGSGGVGLWVSADSAYKAPRSVQWTPSDAQRASLEKTVKSLESALVAGKSSWCTPASKAPVAKRTLFFTMQKAMEDEDGTHAHWAVVGGPVLIIARLEKSGRWVGRNVEASAASICAPKGHHPRAVFDVDGDGYPEIFEHADFGDSFDDVVWKFSPNGQEGTWSQEAHSVASGTA